LSLKSPFLYAALDAAKAKFRVFPVTPASKIPAIKDWQANATSGAKTVKRLWRHHPNANIGVVTGGEPGLFVLDVDGDEGRASLEALEQDFGRLPPTVAVCTPRGSHYYFRGCEPMRNSAGKLGPGLDGRGDGGYVIGAGSVSGQGAPYRYVKGHSPDDVDIAAIPAWLVMSLSKDAQQDTHSSSLTSVDSGASRSYILTALQREADACAKRQKAHATTASTVPPFRWASWSEEGQ
jgi:putative DNA primase/helicase